LWGEFLERVRRAKSIMQGQGRYYMGCGWNGLPTFQLYEEKFHLGFQEEDEIETVDDHFLHGDLSNDPELLKMALLFNGGHLTYYRDRVSTLEGKHTVLLVEPLLDHYPRYYRYDDETLMCEFEQQQALATLEREIDGLRDPIDRLSPRQDDLTRWSLGITSTHKAGNPLPLSTAPEDFIPLETACFPPWSNPPPPCGNSFANTYLRDRRVVDQVYEDMVPVRGLDLLDRPTQAGILSVGADTEVQEDHTVGRRAKRGGQRRRRRRRRLVDVGGDGRDDEDG
jgi:hypothetical protein